MDESEIELHIPWATNDIMWLGSCCDAYIGLGSDWGLALYTVSLTVFARIDVAPCLVAGLE